MNGQSSGAFRRALTDALLEEYAGESAVPKASKRGAGNGLRRLRAAVLAAVLILAAIGMAAVATDGFGFRVSHTPDSHYVFDPEREAVPADSIRTAYMPTWVPYGYESAYEQAKNPADGIYAMWKEYESRNTISFSQSPLKTTFVDIPENSGYINWNGFEIAVFEHNHGECRYVWNDRAYVFHLDFDTEISEEDRFKVFDSITVTEENLVREYVDVRTVEQFVSVDAHNVEVQIKAEGRPQLENTAVTVYLEKKVEDGHFTKWDRHAVNIIENGWSASFDGDLVEYCVETVIDEPGEYRVVVKYLFEGKYRQQAVTMFEEFTIE